MQNKKTLFFWIIPLIVVCSSFYFLGEDAPAFIRWWISFLILGIIFMPFTSYLFKGNTDAGYLFSKPLALMVATFTMWTVSYLYILPFRFVSIAFILAIFTALNFSIKKYRRSLIFSLNKPKSLRLMAIEETIFAASLLFWSFARGLKPLLDSLEKPMNFGFMMSMIRTDFFPAKDMWYAQGNINYYYYGQYVYTFMSKMSFLNPDVSYNLSLATTFALTASLSFAICYMLISFSRKKGLKLYGITPGAGGIIGAFFVTLGGNSHSFFYGENHPGNWVLKILYNNGWLAKLLPGTNNAVNGGEPASINIKDFWFPNSTRFIGYNPLTSDRTIHEFPYYSFLVADLHAHLINLAFVLLFISFLFVLLNSSKMMAAARNFWLTDSYLIRNNDKKWIRKEITTSFSLLKTTAKNPIFIMCGLLLGIFMMCNFWDFAIYLVVMSMTLLVINFRGYGKLGNWETIPVFLFQMMLVLIPFLLISNPYLALLAYGVCTILCFLLLMLVGDSFTICGAQISLLFFISHLTSLPFNLNFEPMAKSVALSINRTPIFQLGILWGTHLFVGALFIIYIIRRRVVEKTDVNAAVARCRGKIARFFAGINPVDLFVCGLFVCGFLFVLLPEIIYVVDIYSGDFKRANTMFKFTYQGFVMLSLVIGYSVARVAMTKGKISRIDKRWSFVAIIMVLVLFIPAYYPYVATRQWLGEFKIKNYQGLDGLDGLQDKSRLEAIRWINENIKGQPVLLEAYGDSYTHYNQLSAYTGLPTLMGWQTHEWLWRTSKVVTDGYNQIVRPRQREVEIMYEYTDAVKANNLFKKYRVEYIAVGLLEKTKFPNINEFKLKALGEVVFEYSSLYIIKVLIDEFDPDALYTVTFECDYDCGMEPVNVTFNDSITEPAAPVRTGYTFGGWYKNQDLIGPWDFNFDGITEDTTLYAKWDQIE